MAKTYVVQFGTGTTGTTGLTPTFTVFNIIPSGGAIPPGITEIPSGTGFYYFIYEPVVPILFVIDGGSSLSGTTRFVTGDLDPSQAVDERIGTLSDSFGTTLTDPTSLMGFAKRNQEWNEGDSQFTKTSGNWAVFSRGNTFILGATTYAGSSTQLTAKTLVDNGSIISKT